MSGNVKTLWGLMKGQRFRYALAFWVMLLGALMRYLKPQILRDVLDVLIEGKTFSAAGMPGWLEWLAGARRLAATSPLTAAGALVSVTAVGMGFAYLKGRWTTIASESIARNLRDRLYNHLQHLPARFFHESEAGDLVQRCTSDVETVRLFLARQTVEAARVTILVGLGVPILLTMNLKLGLLSLIAIPVLLTYSLIFLVKVRATFKSMDESEGRMTAQLQENLHGIRVVRAFARQKFEREKFAQANADYRSKWYRLIRMLGWFWPVTDIMVMGQQGLILLVGVQMVAAGRITVGTLMAFLFYAHMFLWPVRHIGRVLAEMGKAQVSIGRLGHILDQAEESDSPQARSSMPPARIDGNLVFENLSFRHDSEVPVLRDVSFEVAAGKTVAILGPSGSGKSTLIHLLLRLYDYDQGSIRLDGRELHTLPRKFVRAQIGVVLQEPFLFSRTLRDNIQFAHPRASHEKVVAAARDAAVHDSIQNFREGYDTLIGEKGITLSGGQRQRVALARAMLKDPPILILDDALSSVDTETESMILEALSRRPGRATTLVIAHRLTTLMRADQILVFDEGRIVQAGTHETLISAEGMYRRLWRVQSLLEEDLDQSLREFRRREEEGGAKSS